MAKKRKKPRRRLSVKIRDGRKKIQIAGKKYTLVPVRKRKSTAKRKTKRRLPPRIKTGKRKGQFRKRKK